MKKEYLTSWNGASETWSKTMDLRWLKIEYYNLTDDTGRYEYKLQQKSISNLGNIEWNFIEESDE